MAGLRKVQDAIFWPLRAAGLAYCRAAEKHPFVVGVLTTGFKTSAADLFAQKIMEKREKIDWTRQAAFSVFGFCYLGAFQYFLYTRVLNVAAEPITRTMGHIASAPFKTFLDQAIHHPFMYFPAFYILKYVLVKGESPSVAYSKYEEELWTNCTALWTIWVPAQMVNFSVVPPHLQIPYCAAVSFVWTVVLSTMRGAFEDKTQVLELAEGGGEGARPEGEAEQQLAAASTSQGTALEEALPAERSVHAAVIPSPLEQWTAVTPEGQRSPATHRGDRVRLRRRDGVASAELCPNALAAHAACGRAGVLALQHPLRWETGRAAQICGWEAFSTRMHRRTVHAHSVSGMP